jgi:hypothetical protein
MPEKTPKKPLAGKDWHDKPKPPKPPAPETITCGDCGKKWPRGTVACDCGYEL